MGVKLQDVPNAISFLVTGRVGETTVWLSVLSVLTLQSPVIILELLKISLASNITTEIND